MKAISLWQPWATLMVIGAKRNETRDWETSYRGRILIHAAKTTKSSGEFDQPEIRKALTAVGYWSFYELPFGAIVGAVTISDCVRTESIRPYLIGDEEAFGNYDVGRYAWTTFNPAQIEPVLCRGMQKIFAIPPNVANLLKDLHPAEGAQNET